MEKEHGANLAAGEGIPGILIENCFINGNDSRFIDSDAKIQLIAKANAEAIIEYYGLKLAVSMKADKTETNILKGSTAKVNVGITPVVNDRTISWSSNNNSVATVDSNGVITGVGQGTCKITATTVASKNSITVTVNVNELKEEQNIEIQNLKKEHTVLSKIEPGTSIDDFMNNINVSDDLDVVIKNFNGKILNGDERIGTGTVINIKDKDTGKVIQQYECIVYGDVAGEGTIDSMSMFKIRQHLLEANLLEGAFLQAANVSKNSEGRIDSMSMFTLRQHLLGNRRIEQ